MDSIEGNTNREDQGRNDGPSTPPTFRENKSSDSRLRLVNELTRIQLMNQKQQKHNGESNRASNN
jgi:hypothetical protein